MSPVPPGASGLGWADDQAGSVVNSSSAAVPLHDDPSHGGSSICLSPDAGIDNLALFGRNDSISSVGAGPARGCG